MRHQFVRSPMHQQQQIENSRNSLPRDDLNSLPRDDRNSLPRDDRNSLPRDDRNSLSRNIEAVKSTDFVNTGGVAQISNRQYSPNKTSYNNPNKQYNPHKKSSWDGRQSVPTILNDSGHQIMPGGVIPDGRKSVPPQAEYRTQNQPRNHEHQRSMSPGREDIGNRPKLAPPTAPKPKTPVHFNHQQQQQPEPIRRNATVHDFSEALHQYNERQSRQNDQQMHKQQNYQQQQNFIHQQNFQQQQNLQQQQNFQQQNFQQQQSFQQQNFQHQQNFPQQQMTPEQQKYFLDGSLPPHHNTSTGEVAKGRQEQHQASPQKQQSKTQTLPARIKYTENSPRNPGTMNTSFDPEESPRTSKSGLPSNTAMPVPPSPRGSVPSSTPSPRGSTLSPPQYQNPPEQHKTSDVNLDMSDQSLPQRQTEKGKVYFFALNSILKSKLF